MLTVNPTCQWDVSEQGSRQRAVCAKCNEQFEAGDLRLRPAGTRNTRLIHPTCSHGMVSSLDAISNLADLTGATRQRLERALTHAGASHGASGDVPHPDISDPQHAEIAPIRIPPNSLKHLELLDQFARTCRRLRLSSNRVPHAACWPWQPSRSLPLGTDRLCR